MTSNCLGICTNLHMPMAGHKHESSTMKLPSILLSGVFCSVKLLPHQKCYPTATWPQCMQCENVQCGKDKVDDTCSPTTLNTHLGRMNSMCCPSVEVVIIWQPVATMQDIFSNTTRKAVDKASVCHWGKEGYNNGRPGPSCTYQPLKLC